MNISYTTGNNVVHTTLSNNFTREISHIPTLTAQEEKALFKEYAESKKREAASKDINVIKKEKDIQVKIRQEVISRNQRFNYAIAKRYNSNELLMDLVSVGAIGMHEAFENFDYNEDNPVRFCTYAVYYIRRAINAYLNKDNLMVKTTNSNKIIPKVKKIRNKFFAQNGCYPSTEYIIKTLDTEYGIKNASPAEFYKADVCYIDQYDTDNDSDLRNSQDHFMAKSRAISVNDFESTENNEHFRTLVNNIFKKLNDREITIISMAFGYGYDKEYKDYEIAEVLDISAERVRQIRIQTIAKLRNSTSKVYANAY